MTAARVRSAGVTHTGNVRTTNEDAYVVDAELGLYVVLDGMGGAMAGDIASSRARDVIHAHVRAHHGTTAPRQLLTDAINTASAAVHAEASVRRDRKGMGTTVVACLMVDEGHAVIAHVGDSRIYLLREGRLEQLTRDHTVVAELLERGALTLEDAARSAYRNVLSRNLGAKPEARVEVADVSLAPGDRVLLCSDGLHGFASAEAVLHVLGGGDGPEQAARDLLDAALRGGGGDNVTAVVLEVGRASVPRATQIIRSSGAGAWLARRERFLAAARDAGLAQSPICAMLAPAEALEIVGGNLYEAVFHDLEQTTGINVWTYAENLAHGWFDQGGAYEPLRHLQDILRAAAAAVLADIRAAGEPYAVTLEIAVTRALVVAEIAVGNVVAERLRAIELELVKLHSAAPTVPSAAPALSPASSQTFVEQRTMPYMQAVRIEAATPEVIACLQTALGRALAEVKPAAQRIGVAECLHRAHRAAVEPVAMGDAATTARELYGVRALEEVGVSPLLDALDQARELHLAAARQVEGAPPVKAAAVRRLAASYQRLTFAISELIVDAGQPITAQLHEAVERTAALRAEVSRNETRVNELERRLAARGDVEPVRSRP